MAEWLCISVTFLNGRYHGLEWPPSPARLFQALLAGAMTGRYREQWEDARPVLEWLERQPPPAILGTEARPAATYRLAVPNNDLDVAGNEWRSGKTYDTALLRTMKTVRPHVVGRPENAPHVHYLWLADETGKSWTNRVRALSDCLHTLGWGVDMAFAQTQILSDPEVKAMAGARWNPSAGTGLAVKVPVTGSLDDLRSAFERFKARIGRTGIDPDTRGSVYGLQRYAREGRSGRPYARFNLLRPNGETFSYRWREVMLVAAWMRHQCAGALEQEGFGADWINEYVHGHEDGSPKGRRISFLPLPTIGHTHSDGRVRRVLITEPPDADGETARLLQIKLAGARLTDLDGHEVCQTAMADDTSRVWPRYLRQARVWHSVTPVVLHGHNSLRGKFSVHKTERLILQAFEASGFPARLIEGVSFQAAPLWRGAEGALEIRVPEHLKRWPRYHVEVRFHETVEGPVFAGIGRHCGIGIFAAPDL
jgi:CRISPR-associated protein Csb2